MKQFADVHDAHCCKIHGCKYGDDDCTVVNGPNEGIMCEECYNEPSVVIEDWGRSVAIVVKKYFEDDEVRYSFDKEEDLADGIVEVFKHLGIRNVEFVRGE